MFKPLNVAVFAAAGEALELTGSAVSKAVALLEQELGVPLFLRSTRGITLTGDGRRFLARCREALSLLDEARETQPRVAARGARRSAGVDAPHGGPLPPGRSAA